MMRNLDVRQKVDRAMYQTVNEALHLAMYWAGGRVVNRIVHLVGALPLTLPPDGDVFLALKEAVTQHGEPPHLGLRLYLAAMP